MHDDYRAKLRIAVAAAGLLTFAGGALAQNVNVGNSPPLPVVNPTCPGGTQCTTGNVTIVNTPTSPFPPSNPFVNPTNMLPTYYGNVKDLDGSVIPDTLPSTPTNPYNLMSDVSVVKINAASPADDLEAILKGFHRHANKFGNDEGDDDPIHVDPAAAQRAIDIIEGNPVPNRVYSGFPLLHFNGPDKFKQVQPILDASGNTIGGNVVINQIWYRSHIESDTSLLDVSKVKTVPWTVTYHIFVLNRGEDDFSPMIMYLDHNPTTGAPAPGVMMDGTFYPMQEGTELTLTMHEAPGKFFNLIYHWGWRVHPGRVQVTENAAKMIGTENLLQYEQDAFGMDPDASAATKAYAISRISNLAPAKRMLIAFEALKNGTGSKRRWVHEAEAAFSDWEHRSRLPRGVKPDPNADITLFECNNTIYGQVKGYLNPNGHAELPQWTLRGTKLAIKVINGDYYQRGYMAADFGGLRGWENTFFSTIPIGGDGPWFTFGRDWWWIPITPTAIPAAVPAETPLAAPPPPAVVAKVALDKDFISRRYFDSEGDIDADDAAANAAPGSTITAPNGDTLSVHWFYVTLNYEPSPRLSLYQFDPFHHDEAIFSLH